MKNQQYEEATKLLIKEIEENPTDPINFIHLANLLEIMEKNKEAERFYLKAIELDENSAAAFVGLGNIYYRSKLYEEAEKMLQHSLRLGLEDSDVHYLLGMTHVKRKQLMLALPFFQRAAELDGEPYKLFQYGLTLAQTKYFPEAEKVLHEVLEKEPQHADALYNLGVIEMHKGNKEAALNHFQAAIRSQSNHTLAKHAKEALLNESKKER